MIAIIALNVLAGSAGAVPVEEWNRTFGGAENDYAYSVEQTQDGGYILAGSTASYGAGNHDAWIIKTDSNGNMQWSRTFGEKDDDQACSIQQTSDEGFIIAGLITTSEIRYMGRESPSGTVVNAKNGLVWLIKIDKSGKEQWNKKFGESGIFGVNSVDQTADGGFILSGMASPSGSAGSGSAWIIKTDAKGMEQWNRTLGGDVFGASFVQQTKDNGYIVTGLKSKLFKIDPNGKEEWSKIFRRKGLDDFNSAYETQDNGYIIAGSTQSYGADDRDAWLIKTDTKGNEQWNRTYGTDIDFASSVQQTEDGGYIVAGWRLVIGTGDENAWLIKTDANGNEEWNMTFAGVHADRIYSVQKTQDGGYILAGGSESYGAGGADAWLIKVSGETNITAHPAQISSIEHAAGFEAILAIMILLIVYIAGLKRR